MLVNDEEYTSIHDADVHVSIFPHLDEFIVLDYRDAEHPAFRVVHSSELLTPPYYREIESEFSRILYSGEAPFVNLMTLPQRLELFLRAQGIKQLTGMLPEGSTDPRVSIFICGTSIVDMSDDDLNLLLQVFFEDGPPEPFVREYCQVFQRLLIEERAGIRAKEMDELRLAVQGRSNHFFTIWQEGGGPGLN